MRFLSALLFIFTLPLLSVTNAEARGFGVIAGSSQNLEYVEDSSIPPAEFGRSSGVISVCRVSKSYHLFFLSIWKEAGHYGLSDAGCTGESYYTISRSEFQQAQRDNQISKDLPSRPTLTFLELLMGSYGVFVFLALGLYLLNRYKKQQLKDKELQQSMDQADPADLKALGAMAYIAGVDGKIDADEIALIHRICRENLGDIFDTDLITQVCNDAAASLTHEHFKDYAPDLTPEQHLKVLKSAFQVASADGEISDKERDFLEILSADMGISTEVFDTLLAENSTPEA